MAGFFLSLISGARFAGTRRRPQLMKLLKAGMSTCYIVWSRLRQSKPRDQAARNA